ncbi:MAG: folylpolyglutamate synthase/dihydrofolate synthase family protein [Candidatus Limnocylindrales bacterium]
MTTPAQDADPRYRAVLERLQARGRFGIRLGLGRTRALLHRLGDPHRGLRGALIAGTNGKGSTQALVASVLREAGFRVGQTPKPHLVSYRERIVVDGRMISASDFADVVEEVIEHAAAVEGRHGPPTEFEVLTAAAFAHFARAGVDVAVVEVGLGGRLDATNAWQGGVSAITNVGLDHMEYLGNTVAAIAREKAHIIKRGDFRVVTAANEPALSVIRRRASAVKVPLEQVPPLSVTGMSRAGLRVLAPDGSALRIGLIGRHQAANAAVALGIIDALDQAGIAKSAPDAVQRGLAKARWPGRLELIYRPGLPTILLDGAHNPDGMAALSVALRELLGDISGGSPTILLGTLASHWQEGMIDPLLEAAPRAAVIATRVPDSTGSYDPSKLARAWGAGATTIADPERALGAALDRASAAGGALIVCGSLYLVGYVRARVAPDPGEDGHETPD